MHRLDKDTSGLMVVAKTRVVMEALVRLIGQREVSRFYLAIAEKPWRRAGVWTVSDAIGRDPVNRLRMAVLPSDVHPKPAKTQFRRWRYRGLSLVACKTVHRTHLIKSGFTGPQRAPHSGDQVYGAVFSTASSGRLCMQLGWNLITPLPAID